MEIITAQTVEAVFDRMWNMPEPEAMRLSYRLEKEQPVLVAYLAAVDKDIFNQAERELLFYLGIVVWQVMSAGKSPLEPIRDERLLSIEKVNQQSASDWQAGQTFIFAEVVKKALMECRQKDVLRYVIAALMDENSVENEVRDEVLGYIILNLKTVIECFDEQGSSVDNPANQAN